MIVALYRPHLPALKVQPEQSVLITVSGIFHDH